MACARITHEVRQSSPARRCFGILLLLAISGLLTACGGEVTPSGGGGPGGGGAGGGAVVCTYSGAAPTVLNWSAEPVAVSYRVYYGTAPSTYQQQFGMGVSVLGTSFQVPNLSPGTTYYFAVTTVDGTNTESVFSNEVCKIIL